MVLETSGEIVGRTIGRVDWPASERPAEIVITQKFYPVKIAGEIKCNFMGAMLCRESWGNNMVPKKS
jgi:hypothetical protein